ncbi:MAG: MoxR-like ATPase, partial [Nocardioidaceae bacterium]|nr:MoxR-like ATPase [Nocardioidaceae bacterium]
PIEYEGTYPLPEAQLDRFLMRVSFGYPTADEEYDVVQRRLDRQREEIDLAEVTDAAGLRAMQAATETVTVDETVSRYCVRLATATRENNDVLTGSSPRGSLGLVLAARGFALVRGRDYVIPEDVKAVARAVLSHRITVKPELWMTQASGPRVVDAVLGSVPTPSTLESYQR